MSAVNEVRAAVYRAAMKVACPLCKAVPAEPCFLRGVGFGYLAKPHDRRIDAAREAGHWSIG